jgi:hypothetical protein
MVGTGTPRAAHSVPNVCRSDLSAHDDPPIHIHNFRGYRAEVHVHVEQGVTRYVVLVVVEGQLVPGEAREKAIGTFTDRVDASYACDHADRF